MSLYSHFSSKEELLDLALGRLVHRLFPTAPHESWQAHVERGCRHVRRILLEHPHWIPLLTRAVVPVHALGNYDRMLDALRRSGLGPKAAMFAFSAIMSHAVGSVLVQRLFAGAPPVPKRRLMLIKGMLAEAPRRAYPRVAEALPRFEDWNFDDVFELGLRSLVAGLARQTHEPRARSRR